MPTTCSKAAHTVATSLLVRQHAPGPGPGLSVDRDRTRPCLARLAASISNRVISGERVIPEPGVHDHYSGTEEQHQRQELQNYVNNIQNLLDFGVTRIFSKRVAVSVGIPLVDSSWAMRDPATARSPSGRRSAGRPRAWRHQPDQPLLDLRA